MRLFFLTLIVLFVVVTPAPFLRAEENPSAVPAAVKVSATTVKTTSVPVASKASAARSVLFVVETDADSAVDSLNRVSGKIDRGFTDMTDDHYYRSPNHESLSPFAKQKDQDYRF